MKGTRKAVTCSSGLGAGMNAYGLRACGNFSGSSGNESLIGDKVMVDCLDVIGAYDMFSSHGF